jgi:hypothetical protein
MIMESSSQDSNNYDVLHAGCGAAVAGSWPDLLTEQELIIYLRIPEVSNADNHHNVIENLKRMHDLPRLHLCGKVLYPLDALRQWIKDRTKYEK